ncbi:hypothetical protein, partial [Bifidobacterium adolescentis]|uniref:hypothetical protein n=1 Tax=Bifidobacterium adolescentis TaxID=1680 RepID=UPI001E55808C
PNNNPKQTTGIRPYSGGSQSPSWREQDILTKSHAKTFFKKKLLKKIDKCLNVLVKIRFQTLLLVNISPYCFNYMEHFWDFNGE